MTPMRFIGSPLRKVRGTQWTIPLYILKKGHSREEELNPQANKGSRDQFLSNSDCTDSISSEQTEASIEDNLVWLNDISTRLA